MKEYPYDFVFWLAFSNHPFIPWFEPRDGEMVYFFTDEVSDEEWSLDQMYELWLNKYKK